MGNLTKKAASISVDIIGLILPPPSWRELRSVEPNVVASCIIPAKRGNDAAIV